MQEHIFERMARERNISVEEMRAIISKRIEQGWNSNDPVKREQWRKFPVPERCQRRMNGCGTQLKGLKMMARKVYYGNI